MPPRRRPSQAVLRERRAALLAHPDQLLTRPQVAELLGVSVATVDRQIRSRLVPRKTTQGMIGIRSGDLAALLRRPWPTAGRPRTLPAQVGREIRRRQRAGLSLRLIAEELNRRGVPTAQAGTRWWASSVRGVLR